MTLKKNTRRGNNFYKIFLYFFILFINLNCYADDIISSSPLLNIDKIKPSYEEQEDTSDDLATKKNIKIKKKNFFKSSSAHAIIIGLDKITAKSSEFIVHINETKKFGPLEIKILECGKIKENNKLSNVAYMQVKDLTKNENEKVFIFNGWTFSSDPSITPFDHAIYDLQLLNCNNV